MARDRKPEKSELQVSLRLVGGGFFGIILGIYMAADIFSLPGGRTDFHADPTIIIALGSIMLILLGFEGLAKLPGIARGAMQPPPEEDDDVQHG